MGKPLNRSLYYLLERRFGDVGIVNQGEAAEIFYRADNQGDPWVVLTRWGETYKVRCPLCQDRRQRLHINQLWGKRDLVTGHKNLRLAKCHNADCLSEWENRETLHEEVTAFENRFNKLDKARISPGKQVPWDYHEEVEWPGEVVRVDKLPHDHKAVQYLLNRSFDPKIIGGFYNVHYCIDYFNQVALERLIIPIYDKKRFVGWMSRYIGEIDWEKPHVPNKYHSSKGLQKHLLLYNIENASRYKTGVIVEGLTAVWSFGPMACSTLWCNFNLTQQQLFRRRFWKHSAIIVYDHEEFHKESTQRLIFDLNGQFDRGFAAVKLPEGTDPGKLDRGFLRDFVAKEAKAQGIKVSWKKR